MTVDFTKPVETNQGVELRVLCTDAPGPMPVICLGVKNNLLYRFKLDGTHEIISDLFVRNKKLDFNLPVQTRDGRSVYIFCTDAPGEYPIIGLIEFRHDPSTWTKEGSVWKGDISPDDLVQAPHPHPERLTGSFYVNIYKDSDGQVNVGCPCNTQEEADDIVNVNNDTTRFARLRINFSATKGQLDD